VTNPTLIQIHQFAEKEEVEQDGDEESPEEGPETSVQEAGEDVDRDNKASLHRLLQHDVQIQLQSDSNSQVICTCLDNPSHTAPTLYFGIASKLFLVPIEINVYTFLKFCLSIFTFWIDLDCLFG
jgi:hypothetical protein